jgi:cysteine synthase A
LCPIDTVRRLAREEGLLADVSTDANVWVVLQLARRPEHKGQLIVTFGASSADRCLATRLTEEARQLAQPKRSS